MIYTHFNLTLSEPCAPDRHSTVCTIILNLCANYENEVTGVGTYCILYFCVC